MLDKTNHFDKMIALRRQIKTIKPEFKSVESVFFQKLVKFLKACFLTFTALEKFTDDSKSFAGVGRAIFIRMQ